MLLDNISNVYKRISHAAMRAGRDPSEVVLIAVTKTVQPERIKEAVDLGIRLIGENRVQEAKEKIDRLRDVLPETVQWHMIGHLQKNKVRPAVTLFDMIQSVDSIELAKKINRVAADYGKVQRILIQVKLADEESKHGVTEEALEPLIDEVLKLENLALEGLMTIPPFFDDPELVRPYFRRLRQIRDRLNEKGYRLKELSMGMSGDYEVAIQEGATMVRIGTAIFGRRAY